MTSNCIHDIFGGNLVIRLVLNALRCLGAALTYTVNQHRKHNTLYDNRYFPVNNFFFSALKSRIGPISVDFFCYFKVISHMERKPVHEQSWQISADIDVWEY